MKRSIVLFLSLIVTASVQAAPGETAVGSMASEITRRLQGTFDNREQAGKPVAGGEQPVARVTITIEPAPQADFALWRVHLQTDPQTSYDQTWAMQARIEHDGSGALIPYYQLKQDAAPDAATFDPQHGWLSLEACALRGDFSKAHIRGNAEGEPCVAVSMSVGARRALLPVGIDYAAGTLRLDLNLRGVRTRIEAKRVP